MGAGASSRHAQLAITDPKVCRSFLVGTCPRDLFTNTKQDLGPCPKVHSEPLKIEYEASAEKSKYGFEYDYMRDMQKYIDDCNGWIGSAARRLEKTPDEIRQTNALVRASASPSSPVHMTSPLFSTSLNPQQHQRTSPLTPLTPAAQTNLRPLPHHQHRPTRNLRPRRIRLRLHRLHRVLQGPHRQSRQGGKRARAPLPLRHLGLQRPPEATGVRRVRRVPESAGQRPPAGGSLLWQDALGLCADAEDVGGAAEGVEGTGAAE